MCRNQKAISGNGRSQNLHRDMKATGYAGELAESWWRMPGGVCVGKHYWMGEECLANVRPAVRNEYLRTCPSARMTPSNERLSD